MNKQASALPAVNCSLAGVKFLFDIEVGPHESATDHLHWPGGMSGVTLGPGYDMRERSGPQIMHELVSAGISRDAAKVIAAASGLRHVKASEFVKNNSEVVKLTHTQQLRLLHTILPHYEHIVRSNVRVPLKQHEFDALVSFAYNPAGHFSAIAQLINDGKKSLAMHHLLARLGTGSRHLLLIRRKHEVNLFTHGTYDFYHHRHHVRHLHHH